VVSLGSAALGLGSLGVMARLGWREIY